MHIYRSEIKQEEKKTVEHQSDNEVRQSRLRLRAFVSVGEAFLFLFKDLKWHHKNAKRLQKLIWSCSTRSLEPNKRNGTEIG
jgi:hypothetical protein